MPPAIFCQTLWELSGWLLQPVSFFLALGFLAFGHGAVTITPSSLSYMQICVGSTAITILVRGRAISWLHALKQLNFAPPPPQNHLRMCWVKFSKKLSFSESLHSACSVFVSFFLFLHFVFELLKRLGAPCMFFFLLLFFVLFFIIIQQHFSLRANAFWTPSFLPFQAGCHCCCLWAGCIYLGVIGVWMSEVMRCIHTWLLPSLRSWDRRSLAGLRLELYHTAVSATQVRMALSYPGGQIQSLGLIPQWGVWSGVCMCAWAHFHMRSCACVCGWRLGGGGGGKNSARLCACLCLESLFALQLVFV